MPYARTGIGSTLTLLHVADSGSVRVDASTRVPQQGLRSG
ncbi:MAG: hypothetical protein JWQ68_1741 [Cryobacterium sp.]|jgi:hypothetical protein|nr:hypothetical protein [Cryobacterium sp.]